MSTFGEKAVGVSFNPSQNPAVDEIKASAAAFVDAMHKHAHTQEVALSKERGDMYRLALRKAQEASMWAVKAATWQDEEA